MHGAYKASARVERNNISAIDPGSGTEQPSSCRPAGTTRPSGPGRQRGALRRRRRRRPGVVSVRACMHVHTALHCTAPTIWAVALSPDRVDQTVARESISAVDRPRNNLPPGRRTGRRTYVRAVRARRHGGIYVLGGPDGRERLNQAGDGDDEARRGLCDKPS